MKLGWILICIPLLATVLFITMCDSIVTGGVRRRGKPPPFNLVNNGAPVRRINPGPRPKGAPLPDPMLSLDCERREDPTTNIRTNDDGNISTIIPGKLYLSGLIGASTLKTDNPNNINTVLRVIDENNDIDPSIHNDYGTIENKLLYHFEDDGLNVSFERFKNVIDVLYDTLERDNNVVLVHCKHGINRSPSIVIGYLMKKYNISPDKAMDMVRNGRPFISPKLLYSLMLFKYEKNM